MERSDSIRPLVSIIITCFNKEQFIQQAIQSALAQTYPNKEVIVIDDGSTDQSVRLIESVGDKIKWETGVNRGACAARNRGLSLAQGSYIKFLDGDDFLEGDALEKQVADAGQESDPLAIVFGHSKTVYKNNTGVRLRTSPALYESTIEYVLRHNIQTSLSLYPKEALHSIGGFDERLPRGQEYDLNFRLALQGYRFVYYPDVISNIRVPELTQGISSGSYSKFGADYELKRIRAIRDLLSQKFNHAVPASLLLILSHTAWNGSRQLIREKKLKEAGVYRAMARELDPENYCSNLSAPYKLLLRFFGPVITEYFYFLLAQRKSS